MKLNCSANRRLQLELDDPRNQFEAVSLVAVTSALEILGDC
jgi:hypothetical protein